MSFPVRRRQRGVFRNSLSLDRSQDREGTNPEKLYQLKPFSNRHQLTHSVLVTNISAWTTPQVRGRSLLDVVHLSFVFSTECLRFTDDVGQNRSECEETSADLQFDRSKQTRRFRRRFATNTRTRSVALFFLSSFDRSSNGWQNSFQAPTTL